MPYFKTWTDFMAMGGHGSYVWSCYALTLLFVLGMIFYSRSQRQRLYQDISRQQARQTQRHPRLKR